MTLNFHLGLIRSQVIQDVQYLRLRINHPFVLSEYHSVNDSVIVKKRYVLSYMNCRRRLDEESLKNAYPWGVNDLIQFVRFSRGGIATKRKKYLKFNTLG